MNILILLFPIIFILLYFFVKGLIVYNKIKRIRLSFSESILKVEKLIQLEKNNLVISLSSKLLENPGLDADNLAKDECDILKNNIENYKNTTNKYVDLYKKLVSLFLVMVLNFNKIDILAYLDDDDRELLELDCYTRIINKKY